MKITRSRKDGKNYTHSTVQLETALNIMRREIKSQPVSVLRYMLSHSHPDTHLSEVDKVPLLSFGCVKSRKPSKEKSYEYNGLITIEINQLTGIDEAEEVRNTVSKMPQTLIAFIGSSGKSVKVIIPFVLPDGNLPQTDEAAELFHAQAYCEAIKWYQPQLGYDIEKKAPLPCQTVRQTYDPNLYYNPQASPIRMEQPVHLPGEQTFEEKQQTITDPLQRILPGYERYDRISTLYNFAYKNALKELKDIERAGDRQPFLLSLAENCFLSGVPEEDAVWWTLYYKEWRSFEAEVRYTLNNVYTTKRIFGSKPFVPKSMILVAQLEEFLQRRYRLRRNVIMNTVEYYESDSLSFSFQPVTIETKNSMVINAQFEGLDVWDADIKRYLNSNRIPTYSPIENYLAHLPAWDGKNRIDELADRLPCDAREVWRERFHRWFLSMVAHWQGSDKKHANSYVPLLVGGQGTRKSTFCSELIPPQLMDYYTDSIDLSKRKDTILALTRYLLINIDEFDSVKTSHQGFLKHIIQKSVIQERPLYGSVTRRMRRYATFMATCNNFDLLNDPSGSRRFLCVEVKGIVNNSQPIDYAQLYSQAVAEVEADAPYWFTYEEEEQITEDNRKFRVFSPEEEYFRLNFRKPEENESGEWLLTAEILERIKKYYKGYKYTKKTAIMLGRMLSASYENKMVRKGKAYHIIDIHET